MRPFQGVSARVDQTVEKYDGLAEKANGILTLVGIAAVLLAAMCLTFMMRGSANAR
jgi:hypothetical protein